MRIKFYKRVVAALMTMFICASALGTSFSAVAKTIQGTNGTMNITSDDNYIYLSYEGAWSYYLSTNIGVSADNAYLGNLGAINLNQSITAPAGELTVLDAWSGPISGASGTFTNSGEGDNDTYQTIKWSVKIPLSTYENVNADAISLSWEGQTATVATKSEATETTTEEVTTEEVTEEITEEATTEATTEEVTEATTEVTTEEATTEDTDTIPDDIVTSGLVIDGMFADWNSYPKTVITYMSNNSDCNHYGQLAIVGDRLYAHFKASDIYSTEMRIHNWNVTINGQRFVFQIQPEAGGNIDWSRQIPTTPGIHTGLKVFVGYGNNNELDSQVAYRIYENDGDYKKGDQIEFSVSLQRLSELTGIAVDQMGTITIQNDNLGGKGVTIAGTPTGPIVGVALGAMVCFGAVLSRRKREED